MTPGRFWRLSAAAPLLPLAGCGEWQSALHPHGDNAETSFTLIWIFTVVCAVVWVLVMLALAWAMARRRSAEEMARAPLETDRPRERRFTRIVGAAVAVTVVILVALTITSYFAGKSIAALTGTEKLVVHVTGNQWWWDVRYESPDPSKIIIDANEIHIPVGEPVKIELASNDVIHSFWVPALAGKHDLIPGRWNEVTLLARKAGIYRGQCAEFCGFQHAHMAITVVAQDRKAFDAWRKAALAEAVKPANDEQRRGQQVFLTRGCVLCHAVRGTPAGGTTGPDLTHVASRQGLAADTLPMNEGALAAWIGDPQAIKPGTKMPRVELSAGDLDAVVAYVGSLK
jgi:cytochrome c oxidase subunit 2